MIDEDVTRADEYVGSSNCFYKSNRISEDSQFYCCKCAHKRRATPLTCLTICFIVLLYNIMGGFLFLSLEGNISMEETVAASKPNLSQGVSHELRSKTVEKLWAITEDLNILYKENWTKLAAKELMDFQKVLIKTIRGGVSHESKIMEISHEDYKWTFTTSFLYALTLITTIGHGNVTPSSNFGKLAAVGYSCIGIPLIMLYLSTIGEALSRNFRVLYSKLCTSRMNGSFHPKSECINRISRHNQSLDVEDSFEKQSSPFQAALNLESLGGGYHWICKDHTRVPVLLSLLLVIMYIVIGAVIFHETEKWSLVDGCFFSFLSLATIGIGEMRPGAFASTVSAKAEDVAIGVCCIYILVGVVVFAMGYNLIHEDLVDSFKSINIHCSGSTKSRAIHSSEGAFDERRAATVSVVS